MSCSLHRTARAHTHTHTMLQLCMYTYTLHPSDTSYLRHTLTSQPSPLPPAECCISVSHSAKREEWVDQSSDVAGYLANVADDLAKVNDLANSPTTRKSASKTNFETS